MDVSPQDVEFFTSPHSVALRLIRKPITHWTTLRKRVRVAEAGPDETQVHKIKIFQTPVHMKEEPYKIDHGRRIIFNRGVYKMYKGYVRETKPDGQVIVELDAVMQNRKRINLLIPDLTLL